LASDQASVPEPSRECDPPSEEAECVEQRALTDRRRVGLVVAGRYLDRVGLRPGVKRKDDSGCRR
jgi:hypothetical protein